jgi:hypothetical protein
MLTALMVAYNYPYKLVLGPALVMFLVITLALLLKYPSLKSKLSVFLIATGLVELAATMSVAFIWGFFIGVATSAIGVLIGIFVHFISNSSTQQSKFSFFSQPRISIIKKALYVSFAIIIVVSSMIISIRATNIVHEEYLETYHGGTSSNLTLKGTINSVALNYEVNTGYSYHIFPAYITLNVTEVIWGGHPWENQTTVTEYVQHRGSIVIYFEKTDVPSLAVGRQVEVNGYYYPWMEDSLYSYTLVVSPIVNGSYLNPL